MHTILDGRRLAYDDAGQGVPCVLLHAFPLDRRMFGDLPARLGPRARVIAPDLRGFGDSELDGPYSIADLADDVAGLLDHLRLDRAVIGGVSMGGYVALAFAARHARRLAGLVLADTKASPDSDDARAARDEAAALVRVPGRARLRRTSSSAACCRDRRPRTFATRCAACAARRRKRCWRAWSPCATVPIAEPSWPRSTGRPW